jgi:predicted 2-oxoglutarate/Fe(II)-dependent dioxygenase YbiX
MDLTVDLSPGDAAPFCVGSTLTGVFYSFQGQAGRAVALILAESVAAPELPHLVAAFARRLGEVAALESDVVLLTNGDPLAALEYSQHHPSIVPIVVGFGDFFAKCRLAQHRPAVLVLDRNLRIAGIIDGADGDAAASQAIACLAALPAETPRDIVLPAPALFLPNLIGRTLCRALIERFETGGNFESGFATVGADGAPLYKVEHAKKRRRDLLIDTDDPYHQPLCDLLLRRCAPEMKKAFQAEISHIDRLLVARYDTEAGWFRRHRDNGGPNVAFRQFALTLNLNTEDYEGGHLVFPEYNAHRYRPPTGGGIIFSASVLHEALPVTSGARYVLLTFLHNREAEAQRLACLEPAGQTAAE